MSRLEEAVSGRAWTFDYGIARALIVRLDDGSLMVVSPPSGMREEGWAEIDALGRVAWLVAPNHFHTGGLGAWSVRYPDARVVAETAAHARLVRRVPGLRVGAMEPLRAALPLWCSVVAVPWARQGEVMVVLEGDARVWYVVDALVYETRLEGVRGWIFRLIGFRTELQRNPIFWRLFAGDRARAAAWWADRLAAAPPDVFVPAHGRTIRADAGAALSALFVGQDNLRRPEHPPELLR